MKIQQVFKQVPLWSILGTAFLSVLLVVPITDSFVDHTKSYLLFFSGILVILFFLIKTIKEKSVKMTVSPITGSLFLFGLAATASTFFTSSYPVKALLGMGGIYISTSIIAILGGSLIPKNTISKFVNGMTVTSVALVVVTILQMIGFGPAQLINQILGSNLPTDMSFNIAGSSFIALQILGITLVGIILSIAPSKKISKFFAISIPIMVVGAGIFTWSLLPGKPTSLNLPPMNASWSIMLDAVKNPRSALIGAGPSAYSNVYTAFKPLWMNNTDQWSAVFSQARVFPLTLLSTMGVIGLGAWLFFVAKFSKLKKRSLESSRPLIYMIGFSLFLQFILPINTIMLTIQAVAIACLIANEKHRLPLLQFKALSFKFSNKETVNGEPLKDSSLPTYLFAGLGLAGVATMFYFVGRVYGANIIMAQSSRKLAENDLVSAYELQQEAVSLNPYLDSIRRRYSSTNMIIAIALSNKADISQTEREQVSSLLQQSVREARTATTLNPNESQNWANLAQIYQNMIGVSEDATEWTTQSYVAAIETNPNDPALRIELAKVFASQENYQQAINIISQAIDLKPDLAGSHFNLALILERLDQPEAYRQARISYQRALVLLDSGSEEYVIVNKKIEEIEFTMKEKGVSLEAEVVEEAGQEGESTDAEEVPSITEQNLIDTKEVGSSEDKDVNLDVSVQDKIDDTTSETNLSEDLK